MILAITRGPLPWHDAAVPVVRQRLGSWHVLAVADDPFTRLDETGEGVRLSDSPFTALDQEERGIGVFATVTPPSTVTLRRSLSSGSNLYYTVTPDGGLICATRVTALRTLGVRLEEDRARLPEFFVYCFVCPPATLFRNISLLTMDETLVFADDGGRGWRIADQRFFELPRQRERQPDGIGQECADVLIASMAQLGPLDDRTAVLLSGGVDSSVLAHLALGQGYRHPTFGASYPFEDRAHDLEAEYATSAATALGMAHVHHVPTLADYLDGVIHAISAAEIPLHGLQTVLLGRLYRDRLPASVRTIVVGDGADSVFGNAVFRRVHETSGVTRIERLVNRDSIALPLRRSGTRAGDRLASALWRRRPLLYDIDDPRHLIWEEQRFGDVAWTQDFFGADAAGCARSRRDLVGRYAHRPLVDRFFLLNVLGNNETLQTMWARIARASGRSAYHPYTHPDVIGSITSIPWAQRFPGRDTKPRLREAARLLQVPDVVLSRPKAYFGVAPNRWASRGGVLEPLVAIAAPVVGEDTIRRVQVSDDGLSRIYWNLLNYAVWRRLFIDGEPAADLVAALQDRTAMVH